jgi:group II intron reverse transcriptase/maturase
MQEPETIQGLMAKFGKEGKPLTRVYRQLFNPKLFLRAYGKIYRNRGATTPGTTEETVDAMSESKISLMIEELKAERWRWSPAKRVHIPKPKGGRRPLGIPTWSDKLIEEVLRFILEAYYEPKFSESSHGFRPGKGCHTALEAIQNQWTGVKWFIEGDIKGCFDNIDHEKLIEIIGEDVQDNRLLRLLRNLLKAGYMEDWRYGNTYSGTPQGAIISPLLSNIYLDKLDKYVENVLIPKYTRGAERRRNKEYESLINKANYWKRKGRCEEEKRYRQQARKLPSADPNDPNFRRLKYVRYADDFLLGFIGPKEEAEAIKEEIREFLHRELLLQMSAEKTLITNARDGAHFLGYVVHAQHADDQLAGDGKRHVNAKIGLRVPDEVTEKNVRDYERSGKPLRRTIMLGESDYTIIRTYNDEFRGLVEYYKLAWNVASALGKVKWAMEKSLVATLAGKHKISARQVYRRYRTGLDGEKFLVKVVPREGKRPLVATWGRIKPKREGGTINDLRIKRVGGRSELEQRLVAGCCELCEATSNIEVHHIRALKDIWRKPDKAAWEKVMIARQRKTLVVCRDCHVKVHTGRHHGRKSIESTPRLNAPT